MLKHFKLCTLIFGTLLVFGCASSKSGLVATDKTSNEISTLATTLPENNPLKGKLLVKKAKSALGTPYVLGGSKPGGFDCSGLVQWAYNSVGVEVPRTAREQSVIGKKVNHVKDMRAGDIVAFRHPKRGYHTGIYVGEGKFVHSPRTRSHVRINSLTDPYFRDTLLGARRVKLDGSENLVAQAKSRLQDYAAQQSQLRISANNLEKIKARSSKTTTVAKGKTQQATKSRQAAKNQQTAKTSKKSTIAQQARKVQSIKQVTGKMKTNTKNSGAHDKLASASKKTTQKTVSVLQLKKKPAARARHS